MVPNLAPPGGETLKRSKKNRPAPQPPRPSDLEIRAPSELLVGVPGALKTQWKHQPFVLVTGAVTYVANVSIFVADILFVTFTYSLCKKCNTKCTLSYKNSKNTYIMNSPYTFIWFFHYFFLVDSI